jgi:hypothetical protein
MLVDARKCLSDVGVDSRSQMTLRLHVRVFETVVWRCEFIIARKKFYTEPA